MYMQPPSTTAESRDGNVQPCHTQYPLWLSNHGEQRRRNQAILGMRGGAQIPRANVLLPRPTASRGAACVEQRRCDIGDAQGDGDCQNHARQRHLAAVESTLWIQPWHSNCRRRR